MRGVTSSLDSSLDGDGERNSGISAMFTTGSSLTNWGRTGFDGDMSGLWLHAELIAS
jgi:hypothetical protein